MIAGGEDFMAANSELACDFGESRSFVIANVAEARIDVVSHEAQVRNLAAIIFKERLNGIGVLVRFGDEAERGILIFIECGNEEFIDPVDEARDILSHTQKEFGMGEFAALIPLVAADVLRGFMAIDLALDDDEVVGLDAEAGAGDAFHDAGEVATGINDPLGALALKVTNE